MDKLGLPQSLAANRRLSRWIGFDRPARQVQLRVGKVEIGQGITTALRQIAADELGIRPDQIVVQAGRTDCTPDELWTSASMSIEVGGAAVKLVCAEVRTLFAGEAARRLRCEPAALTLVDGAFMPPSGQGQLDYFELTASVNLDRDFSGLASDAPRQTPRYVGTEEPRLDLLAKVAGRGFVHDLVSVGMWHARVLRPPRPGVRLLGADMDGLRDLRGVGAIVVDGSFVAVACTDEHAAVLAQTRGQAHLRWADDVESCGSAATLEEIFASLPVVPRTVFSSPPVSSSTASKAEIQANYVRPYVAHASVGTCCALAVPQGDGLLVYTHSQGVFPLRDAIARVLGLAPKLVVVAHADGAGCYGHNGADDVALEAALVAHALGRPVRLAWSRAEELSCAPFGPAMKVGVQAAMAPDGSIIRWHQQVTSTTHLARPGWGPGVNLLAAWQLATPHAPSAAADPPQQPFGGGGDRNAIALYRFGDCRVDYRFSPAAPRRTSAFRSLGAHANVFAIESVLDELACEVGLDALAVRLKNLDDPRAREVLLAATELAGWQPGREGTGDWGWGLGFAQYKNRGAYFAAVVEVELTHKIRVLAVHAAVDCGMAINPDGVRNQIEGGILQAISLTLKEEVPWRADGALPQRWEDYPILGFDEVPTLRIRLLQRESERSLGVGECTIGPIAAAVANAVAHAIGVRVRTMPITVERIAAS